MTEFLELQRRHYVLMEKKRVLISVYTNASGYLYSLMKVDGGTNLGWCGFIGDGKGRCFSSYKKALYHALAINEMSDLETFKKEEDLPWICYTEYLIKKLKQK